MPRQTSASTSTPPQATIEAVEDSTTEAVLSTPIPDPPESTGQVQQQVDNNAHTNEPLPPEDTDSTTQSSSMDVTSDSDTMAPMAQSQAVMNVGSTSPSSTQTIPASRTGLIRPSFTSTWTRPSDPVTRIQPGIAAASVFVLVGIIAVALILVRRWRRNRTRRRARSVINLVNWQQEKNNTSPTEKTTEHVPISEVEGGLFANNAGVGANSNSALDQLKPPIAAKTRPGSVKGFKESPFPSIQSGPPSSSTVSFVHPHAPAKPSPLRA